MFPLLFFVTNIWVLAHTVFIDQRDYVTFPGIIVLFLSVLGVFVSIANIIRRAIK